MMILRVLLALIVIPHTNAALTIPLRTSQRLASLPNSNLPKSYSNGRLQKVKSSLLPRSQSTQQLMAAEEDNENEDIRNEIKRMKLEALGKLNDLDRKLLEPDVLKKRAVNVLSSENDTTDLKSTSSSPSTTESTYVDISTPLQTAENNLVEESSQDELALLYDTKWNLSLDIGREQGTWMPKTWGVSGDRLRFNMEIHFTEEQLYDREEFLGGLGGARIVKVKNNEMTLAPSLTEGIRNIPALQGGWRIGKGEGVMGTDILRFYIEIEDTIRREDGDLYCPAGRIYCNCGYFPSNKLSSGSKEQIRRQLESMSKKVDEMTLEIEEDNAFFSVDKMQKSARLIRLKTNIKEMADKYNQLSIIEPDKSLLKFSKNLNVGMTKEGGACCKVIKTVATEYHILGRFRIASADSRIS